MTAVLFVCIGNACRSQIAEAWLKHFSETEGRSDIEVFSAGSHPLGYVPEITIQTMAEVDIDLSDHSSKTIASLPRQEFDYVISLCGDRCPYVPAEQHIDWPTADPFGGSPTAFQEIREQLKQRVLKLLQEI